MKKFFGNMMAIMGAIAVIWLVFTILRFGAVNMSRAAYETAHYTNGIWHP